GRDIDPIAVTVVTLDDDVAEVDADAELDMLLFDDMLVAARYAVLKFGRTFDRIDDTAELGKKTIADELEDPTMMIADLRFEQFLAVRLQASECACLVLFHESAVADDIGNQYSGETALSAFFGHGDAPAFLSKSAVRRILSPGLLGRLSRSRSASGHVWTAL